MSMKDGDNEWNLNVEWQKGEKFYAPAIPLPAA